MRKYLLFFIALSLLVGVPLQATSFGKTTFRNRSVGINKIIQEVGTLHFTFPYGVDYLNGYMAISAGWEQTFQKGVSDEIGKYFFFNGSNSMKIGTAINQGSSTQSLPGVDIFSENIFLNNNSIDQTIPFSSTISSNPKIQNVFVDFNARLNLDEFVPGLYLDINAPLNWTRWHLGLKEVTQSSGEYIIESSLGNNIDQPSPLNNALAGLRGQTINTTQFPDIKQPLLYGKIDKAQTRLQVADIQTSLGYALYCSDKGHLGIDIRAIFPTASAPEAEYMFEPIVGSGHQYGFGGGMSGHYELWNNQYDSSFSVWTNAKVYTMFSSHQRRIFDLSNKDGTQNIGSHRLLIKRFNPSGELTEIVFGPNVLALQCRVRNHLQTEAALLFDYQSQGFTVDMGYKLWYRSKDKVTIIDQLPANTFGLKGVSSGSNGPTANQTASNTLINGQSTIDQLPVYLSNNDINLSSAEQPRSMTHATFVHTNYAWLYRDYTPFVGCGLQLEFSGSSNSAVDLWGAWIKLGFAFS